MTNAIQPSPTFDYAQLPDPLVADQLRNRADEITALERGIANNIIEIGKHLLAAKEQLEHGQFMAWIEQFDTINSHSTANNYMLAAKRFGENPNDVGNLPASVLYVLAPESVPDDAITEAVAIANAGEPVTPSTARAIRDDHKAIEGFQEFTLRDGRVLGNARPGYGGQWSAVAFCHSKQSHQVLQMAGVGPKPRAALAHAIHRLRQHIKGAESSYIPGKPAVDLIAADADTVFSTFKAGFIGVRTPYSIQRLTGLNIERIKAAVAYLVERGDLALAAGDEGTEAWRRSPSTRSGEGDQGGGVNPALLEQDARTVLESFTGVTHPRSINTISRLTALTPDRVQAALNELVKQGEVYGFGTDTLLYKRVTKVEPVPDPRAVTDADKQRVLDAVALHFDEHPERDRLTATWIESHLRGYAPTRIRRICKELVASGDLTECPVQGVMQYQLSATAPDGDDHPAPPDSSSSAGTANADAVRAPWIGPSTIEGTEYFERREAEQHAAASNEPASDESPAPTNADAVRAPSPRSGEADEIRVFALSLKTDITRVVLRILEALQHDEFLALKSAQSLGALPENDLATLRALNNRAFGAMDKAHDRLLHIDDQIMAHLRPDGSDEMHAVIERAIEDLTTAMRSAQTLLTFAVNPLWAGEPPAHLKKLRGTMINTRGALETAQKHLASQLSGLAPLIVEAEQSTVS